MHLRGVVLVCYFHGNPKGLKQNVHYEINKDRELSQYIKRFVFYLPYILNELDIVTHCDSQRHVIHNGVHHCFK